jgi:hypothetical protein
MAESSIRMPSSRSKTSPSVDSQPVSPRRLLGRTGGSIGLGAESGLRPDGCLKGVHNAVRPPGYPKPSVLTVRTFSLAWRMESNAAHPNF